MFIPKTIDLGQSEKYILSIRINSSGFMFSIHEPNKGKNYCLKATEFTPEMSIIENIKRIIFDFNFLTQEFLQTNVIIVSNEYDMIPTELYDTEKKEQLYGYIHRDDERFLLSNSNDSHECITQYPIDIALYEFLTRSLFNPVFYHHVSLLMSLFNKKNKVVSIRSKIILNFHDEMVDVLCFNQSQFVYGVSYEYESTNNLVYYILNLWDKCGFDQQTDQLLYFGHADTRLISILQEYIKNISIINAPSEIYLWGEDAQKAPLDLLSLSL